MLLRRALQANHVLTHLGVQGRTGTSRDKSLENDFAALFVGGGGGAGVNILRIFFQLIFKYNIKFIDNINKHCRI